MTTESALAAVKAGVGQLAVDVSTVAKAIAAERAAAESMQRQLHDMRQQNAAVTAENVTLRSERNALNARVAELESAQPIQRMLAPWPKRICMNADYRLMKTPDLYGSDTWVAPKVAFGNGVTADNADRYYNEMVTVLRGRDVAVGRELSATTIARASDFRSCPSECMDIDEFSPAVTLGQYPGEPWRQFIDLSHEPTRKTQAELLSGRFGDYPYAFLDNGPALSVMESSGRFEHGLAFVADVCQWARNSGTRLIWNFPQETLYYLTWSSFARLAYAMRDHAWLTEQPYSPVLKQRPELATKTSERYRYLGDVSVPLVMLELEGPPKETWDWAATWKRPGIDRVYLAVMFNEPEPEWMR